MKTNESNFFHTVYNCIAWWDKADFNMVQEKKRNFAWLRALDPLGPGSFGLTRDRQQQPSATLPCARNKPRAPQLCTEHVQFKRKTCSAWALSCSNPLPVPSPGRSVADRRRRRIATRLCCRRSDRSRRRLEQVRTNLRFICFLRRLCELRSIPSVRARLHPEDP